MKPINTVLGSLALKDLGFTLMHEHLLLSDWNLRMACLLYTSHQGSQRYPISAAWRFWSR